MLVMHMDMRNPQLAIYGAVKLQTGHSAYADPCSLLRVPTEVWWRNLSLDWSGLSCTMSGRCFNVMDD